MRFTQPLSLLLCAGSALCAAVPASSGSSSKASALTPRYDAAAPAAEEETGRSGGPPQPALPQPLGKRAAEEPDALTVAVVQAILDAEWANVRDDALKFALDKGLADETQVRRYWMTFRERPADGAVAEAQRDARGAEGYEQAMEAVRAEFKGRRFLTTKPSDLFGGLLRKPAAAA